MRPLVGLEMSADRISDDRVPVDGSRIDARFSGDWYAIQVRPKHERVVLSMLEQRAYEAFLPLARSRRRWSDRVKDLEVPLFEGYLFCRIGATTVTPVIAVPGVVRIVGAGRTLIPVDDDEIVALRQIARTRPYLEPWPYIRVGQRIRIERGPLAGIEGVFIRAANGPRLVVSVSLLQRSVAVEIDRDSFCVVPARHELVGGVGAAKPASGRAIA